MAKFSACSWCLPLRQPWESNFIKCAFAVVMWGFFPSSRDITDTVVARSAQRLAWRRCRNTGRPGSKLGLFKLDTILVLYRNATHPVKKGRHVFVVSVQMLHRFPSCQMQARLSWSHSTIESFPTRIQLFPRWQVQCNGHSIDGLSIFPLKPDNWENFLNGLCIKKWAIGNQYKYQKHIRTCAI